MARPRLYCILVLILATAAACHLPGRSDYVYVFLCRLPADASTDNDGCKPGTAVVVKEDVSVTADAKTSKTPSVGPKRPAAHNDSAGCRPSGENS